MRKTLIFGLAVGTLLFVAAPASAFLANPSPIAAAQETLDNTVEIRGHKFKHRYKHRPPGWSRGKAWWKRGGRGVPPGHR
jgi:hypothetical protein